MYITLAHFYSCDHLPILISTADHDISLGNIFPLLTIFHTFIQSFIHLTNTDGVPTLAKHCVVLAVMQQTKQTEN